MQLLRRLPKKGFNALFKNTYQVVNVGSLERFGANAVIGPAELKDAGLIGSIRERIKILGDGKISKVITIKAHKFSQAAKKMLETAGAKIEYIKK